MIAFIPTLRPEEDFCCCCCCCLWGCRSTATVPLRPPYWILCWTNSSQQDEGRQGPHGASVLENIHLQLQLQPPSTGPVGQSHAGSWFDKRPPTIDSLSLQSQDAHAVRGRAGSQLFGLHLLQTGKYAEIWFAKKNPAIVWIRLIFPLFSSLEVFFFFLSFRSALALTSNRRSQVRFPAQGRGTFLTITSVRSSTLSQI